MRIALYLKNSVLLLVMSAWCLASLEAAETGISLRLTGKVLERGTKNPIEGVSVFILPHRLKAVTDTSGMFVFEAVPEGAIEWVVNASGYQKLQLPDLAQVGSPDQESTKTLYVERESYQVYETTIVGQEVKRDDSSRALRAKDAIKIPGSGNDPIRAVQNLPGVNRPTAFSSQVIIQGSSPNDTRYHIDSHEVPIIFHFAGLSSVVMPEALDRIDYLAAGYAPDFGRAMGGLVGAWTGKPRTDRTHGLLYVDLLNSGAALEGKVGKNGSYFAGVRKSYIGEVFKAVAKDREEFSLTAAPSFSDAIFVYDQKVSDRDHFRMVNIASVDTLEFVLKQPIDDDPAVRGDFYTKTAFFRLIPQWTHVHGETLKSRWSLGLGRDYTRFSIGENYFNLKTYSMTARGEFEHRPTPTLTSLYGYDNRYAWARVELSSFGFSNPGGILNPISSGARVFRNVDATAHQVGLYTIQDWKFAPGWQFRPGARIDRFQQTDQVLPAPRASLKYELDSVSSIRTAGGLYYQPPREQEADVTVGNPDIQAPSAWQGALTYERDFRRGMDRGFRLMNGFFYRKFQDLVVRSSRQVVREGKLVNENWSNGGQGQAYGYEALLRGEFRPWTLWLAYTLSRSTRQIPGQQEFLAEFDQTHNVNLVASVDLPRNWSIASRVRYVTGNPNTPVTGGVFDADNNTFIPLRGDFYSRRNAPFLQADLRIDKKWIYDTWILSFYIEILNVTNRTNVENVQYAYDFSSQAPVTGLPIVPTLGFRGEF